MRISTRVPGVIIRQMVFDDYNNASALWYGTKEIRRYSVSDSRKAIERFLEMNFDTCFVADSDGVLVGTILGGFDGRRGYIHHLVVEEAQRGRNIGGVLLQKTIIAMKAKGVDKMHIFVPIHSESRQTVAFWESHGWKRREDLQLMSHELSFGEMEVMARPKSKT